MNDGLAFAAELVDVLTCGNLHFSTPRNGHDSRAMAAAALVDDDRVHYLGTPGHYRVRSRTITAAETGEPVWYRVLADGSDLHCECLDDGYRATHEIICAHILAAAYREAMRRVWSDNDD